MRTGMLYGLPGCPACRKITDWGTQPVISSYRDQFKKAKTALDVLPNAFDAYAARYVAHWFIEQYRTVEDLSLQREALDASLQVVLKLAGHNAMPNGDCKDQPIETACAQALPAPAPALAPAPDPAAANAGAGPEAEAEAGER